MNEELKEILRSVLKEELQPIHTDIQGLKRDVDSLKEGQRHLQISQIKSCYAVA